MARDVLRYDRMIEDALRSVVRDSLKKAAETGLPGNHHFYITFATGHDGVSMPKQLRAQHSEEMTIVLQHQYWDLEVGEDSFAVSLSFNRAQQRLHIPYAAITTFADPSVQFGLQFQARDAEDEDAAGIESDPADESATPESGEQVQAEAQDGAGEVIALDSFRKNSS
ncbi:MAG: ClpXP protease specificity-enhancing factor SspB [Proteobacteria bacterium]|nr:ClpXP protease specificity-enhancing factor SspB [Pseudomonadota bacterium]